MTLESGGKGEGGFPELLFCPVPLFIISSTSRLVLLDDLSNGNVACCHQFLHEGAGNDSSKASGG